MDLNKTITHSPKALEKKEKRVFRGKGFKFTEEAKPLPASISPQIPWEQVSNLTINDKKQPCTPLDMDIHELIGRGAYGTVHRMVHRNTKTVMAVKRIPLILNTTEQKQTFMDLDVSMRSESCPYVVKFYGAMIEEGEVWICMELMDLSIEGLYQLAFKHQYEIKEEFMRKLAFSVVTALLFLKTKLRVIHRDVKPSNILVNKHGCIKICDFGVSGYLENSLAMTRVGCKFYMSPERIDPPEDCGGFSIKSDVWSFGITMVEVATGKYPYDPWNNPFQQIKQVVEGPTPKLPDGNFSNEMRSFVDICLEKRVERRADYQSLLNHPFLTAVGDPGSIDVTEFVCKMIELSKTSK